ncbi:General alpha-glucoside permease [Zancudomyces culisetae]|uniref:General alpha-glucoside permease n=1 Tax=Zancudomyces culisetae TaxID=1213189 RepID=A0A1R1PK32_ZANCU|nr:General alpha-glucoside permease [Zancudomyces culisetae]|eukprot:OMH81326.1 General alpha-glucoside permease [Zancudomyces culisetae]
MVNSGLNEEDCIPPVENALGVALDSELEEQLVFVLEREVEEQTHVETGAGIRPQKERGLKRWLKNSAHLFDLTIGFLGIQVVWTLEMGYGSLYLMELGLSKSVVSLVWLAGPISGKRN